MKPLLYITMAGVLCAAPAWAQLQSDAMIRQMSEDSRLIDVKENEAPTPAAISENQRSIGDDLKDILQDHKMSQLGRANAVISSQYGTEPLVESGMTPTKASADEKAKLMEEEKKDQAKAKKATRTR